MNLHSHSDPKKVEILFNKEEYCVVYKPAGLLVHPYERNKNERDDLLKRVRNHFNTYVYPVNRLDRPVSGIVVFAKSSEIANQFKLQWNQDSTIKKYIALCKGDLTSPGQFNRPIKTEAGIEKESLTLYWPLHNFDLEYTLLDIEIKTGRRHQIRRHFRQANRNLVGDVKHGKGHINKHFRAKYDFHRIFLQAYYLEFPCPITNEKISIRIPIDQSMKEILIDLNCPNQIIKNFCEISQEF